MHELAENTKFAVYERSLYLSKVKDIEKQHLEKEIRVENEKYRGMQAVLKKFDESPRKPNYRFRNLSNKVPMIRGLPPQHESRTNFRLDIFERLLST